MQDISPQNAVHVIGQATPPLYFNCSFLFVHFAKTFTWNVRIIRHTTARTIALGQDLTNNNNVGYFPLLIAEEFENKYDIERHNLIVKDVDFGDAGTYYCRDHYGDHTDKIAEAIILGKFALRILLHILRYFRCI